MGPFLFFIPFSLHRKNEDIVNSHIARDENPVQLPHCFRSERRQSILYSSGSPISLLPTLIEILPPALKHEEHAEVPSIRGDCSAMLEGCFRMKRRSIAAYSKRVSSVRSLEAASLPVPPVSSLRPSSIMHSDKVRSKSHASTLKNRCKKNGCEACRRSVSTCISPCPAYFVETWWIRALRKEDNGTANEKCGRSQKVAKCTRTLLGQSLTSSSHLDSRT